MIDIDDLIILLRYFLISYMLIWIFATPLIILTAVLYGIPFSTNYEDFIGAIPLYLSTLIIWFSAIPSYYVPANHYFKRIHRELTSKFILWTAFVFWLLTMALDIVFVVIISGINIFSYPFNWIYLGVSPVMILSVYLAGISEKQK